MFVRWNFTVCGATQNSWVTPDEFAEHKSFALSLGFTHCVSGPLVRSSYHAHEHVGAVLHTVG